MRKALIDFEKIDSKIAKQQAKVEVIAGMGKVLVKENASTAQSQDEYIKKYEALSKR